jgi:pyruvate/2-oxoglutarate dehydrogenase complex dihydrolipoamide dehydrogenase (E3) component
MERYNLVVIGGGAAGLTVAVGAAGLGARVALVEAGAMGGECLNTGCIPSKALLRSAATAHVKAIAACGLPELALKPDWGRVSGYVRQVIAAIAPQDSAERFQSLGVEVLLGRGHLASPTRVQVELNAGGRRALEARAVVIATGSRPAIPPIPGLAEAGCLTNETVFNLPALPGRLAILGGGAMGVELGQAFARLGARVTILEARERLLPGEDGDVSAIVTGALLRDGVTVRAGVQVTSVADGPHGKRIRLTATLGGAQDELEVDAILVAAGRLPNLADLGLEQAGVACDETGIVVDARQRSSAPSVYACGDVAGVHRFTHTANQQARVVVQNALFPVKARMEYRAVPWCVFSDPEVARVGLNEQQAGAQGIAFRAIHVDLAQIDRAACDGTPEGFLKVLTPPGRDDILGATWVGPRAGDLIHEIVLAMSRGLKLRHLASTVHAYPTLAEAVRRVGDDARKAAFTPGLRRWVRAYLRWQRG